eukprot:m.297200 g.297200  ORF g.297200 m.297200 type:complete len:360 (+) comp40767_c1_seq61:4749-5828(+)
MVRVYIDHSSARLLPPPVLTLKSTARMRAFHLVSALSTLCVLLAHPKPPKAPCDDGKHGIAIDLPFLTKASYGCQTTKEEAAYRETNHTSKNCADPHPAEHVCMNVKINYTESLPSSGQHRPWWAVYGEYDYCPPERWIHNLEHGGVAFLYHPCAPKQEVDRLKFLARSCLRRHIITPYLNLSMEKPLALVTWGCVYMMAGINFTTTSSWIKEHAMKTDESSVVSNGIYQHWLIEKASVVNGSDITDSTLCPDSDLLLQRFLSAQPSESPAIPSKYSKASLIWGVSVLLFIVSCIILAFVLCRPYKRRYGKSFTTRQVIFTKGPKITIDNSHVLLPASKDTGEESQLLDYDEFHSSDDE